MSVFNDARGRWHGILPSFGIAPEYLTGKHGPCPMCGGKDRWRFADDDGRGNWYCNNCGHGDGWDLLAMYTGWPIRELAAEVESNIGTIQPAKPKEKRDPRIRLNAVWKGLSSMGSVNPVRTYLKRRGLSPTPAIGYHPALDYYECGEFVGRFPAMVCMFTGADGSAVTLHVTHLTDRGEKAPVSAVRKVLTPTGETAGGAIRLFPVAKELAVAEGIETALAVTRDTGIPCWACSNANWLERFQPPEGVERLVIFGDNDASYTGQKSAFALAHRLYTELDVEVRIPEQVGTDFADQEGAA